MALIKLSSQIVDIKGKFGAMQYTRDKSGLHFNPTRKYRPKYSPPKSSYIGEHHSPMGGYYGGLTAWWTMAASWNQMTTAMALLWTIFAILHPLTRPDGRSYTITNWNWFVRCNYYRAYHGLELDLEPPPWEEEPPWD